MRFSKKERDRRVKELDGIRGIAILMVIVWHYFTCLPKTLIPESIVSYIHLPATAFWSGVDLFFVLSGFLIGGIVLDNYEKKKFLKVFWIRRACRILPVLFLLLLVCWLTSYIVDKNQFFWLYHELMPWWTYFSQTQNIAMGLKGTFGGNFLGITWSLAVEEQFYLVVPVLILFFGKGNFVRCIVPLLLTAFLLRLLFPGFHTQVTTIFRMDSLFSGVLVAVIYRSKHTWRLLTTNRILVSTIFMVCVVSTLALIFRGFGNFGYIWFALLYSQFVIVALLYQGSKVGCILRHQGLCFFGNISYGLYMYHQAILGFMHGALRKGADPGLNSDFEVAITVSAFVCSTLTAWVSFEFFELWFLRYAKNWEYSKTSLSQD